MKMWSIAREDRLMKECYPRTAQRIMPVVEEVCNRMEHTGSRMYDEVPDKYMMQMLSRQIYERVVREILPQTVQDGSWTEEEQQKNPQDIYIDDEIFAMDSAAKANRGDGDQYLQEMIMVLLYHELFTRRCIKWTEHSRDVQVRRRG